jgi:sugar-specific transcriptional regulator TrmB
MKVLEPKESIPAIISMVNNAAEFIRIVSPYSYLEGWEQLVEAINKAVRRGVDVSYYVREKVGLDGLERIEAAVFEVPDLHAKMFFSEKEAIISSFHLINNSDINWACLLEYPDEYNTLAGFFEKYISPVAYTARKRKSVEQ